MSLVGSFVHEKAEGLDEYFTALGKLHVLYNVHVLYIIPQFKMLCTLLQRRQYILYSNLMSRKIV